MSTILGVFAENDDRVIKVEKVMEGHLLHVMQA